VLLTPFAENHEAPTEQPPARSWNTITVPTLVACGTAALVLIVLDMLAPTSFVPVQIRGLALVVILIAAVVGATAWIDRRQEHRHEELLASRRPGDCCAIAWVEGLAHRPLPGMSGMQFPGMHQHG